MASVLNVSFPLVFADNTNVFLYVNNADELIKIMTNGLLEYLIG